MLTAEQKLQKAVFKIMSHQRYLSLGATMMIGKREVVDNMPTACTNGRDEFYGRDFVESLNDKEARFLVLHEGRHKVYRHLHIYRWMFDEDPQIANKACDYVINDEIIRENPDGFATMTGPLKNGCYNPAYSGWSVPKVYHDLRQQKQQQGQSQGQPGQGQPGQPGQGQQECFDEHDWEGAKELTKEEQTQLARDIEQALRQGQIAASKVGSGGERDFSELLKPKIDWRAQLREFITATCQGSDYSSWRRPNRRMLSQDIYMPSAVSEKVGELIIAPDMSGSTFTPSMMRAIMSEVAGIAETVKADSIRVLYWDTKVCRDELYVGDKVADLIKTTKPEGGGGTEIECVTRYIKDKNIKAQAVIVLTDGYLGGSWGTWQAPVLWFIADNKSATPNTGKVLHVSTSDM